MANLDITQQNSLSLEDISSDTQKHLLAFDDTITYKLTLNKDAQKILNKAGVLVGIDGEGSCSEVFNDYKNNKAIGNYSHVEGKGTIATADCSHVQGQYNIKDESKNYLHIIGNGTGIEPSERSNAHTVDWDGNAWYAGKMVTEGNVISAGDVIGKNASLDSLKAMFDATGSGRRRPVVRFGTSAPSSSTSGEIGDIYCYIIP